MAQYLDKWLAASVKAVREGQDVRRVRVDRSRPRRAAHRPQTTANLTPLDLQGLYADLAGNGLSARSIHHTHRCLHRAFVQAVRWGLLSRNPCDGVTAPKAARAEMRVLTPEQVNTFLAATREHPAHALYALAVTTGMRQGELLGLRWQDVELDAGRLAVRQALQRQRGNGLVFVEPKTPRSRRTVVLSRLAIAALREHRDRQAFARRTGGSRVAGTRPRVLRPLRRATRSELSDGDVQGGTKAAELPEIRFHDLRHTAATLLLSKGVHVKLVSEMLGHSTITLTLDTYSHLIPAMHGDAAAAMDAALTA